MEISHGKKNDCTGHLEKTFTSFSLFIEINIELSWRIINCGLYMLGKASRMPSCASQQIKPLQKGAWDSGAPKNLTSHTPGTRVRFILKPKLTLS